MSKVKYPKNYEEALVMLGRRNTKNIARNTFMAQYGESIDLVYHSTAVVTFRGGSITINSGGWHTVTTKQRINAVISQHGWYVSQKDWSWYLEGPDKSCVDFQDLTIIPVEG